LSHQIIDAFKNGDLEKMREAVEAMETIELELFEATEARNKLTQVEAAAEKVLIYTYFILLDQLEWIYLTLTFYFLLDGTASSNWRIF